MAQPRSISVMVSAGEASGDAHAAHALEALHDHDCSFTSFGMGAGKLQEAGTELVVDCRELAVIGFVDVLINYPKFMRRLRVLRNAMRVRRPDVLLLVDYPDFNLKLAETAKKLEIPVLFYISPQVWAWRAGRVSRIGTLVSHMAVLFPFEVDIYKRAGIPVTYVGNPVVEDARSTYSTEDARRHFSLDTKNPVVTLLPGSRRGEITRHLPVMIETARILTSHLPECQFLLPVAPTLDEHLLRELIGSPAGLSLSLVRGEACDAMRAASVALVASGTATLETALIGTPMVVMYIVNPINYAIMKRLIKIPDISLVNIVAGKRVVPEYIQHAATGDAMAADLLSLIQDSKRRQAVLDNLLLVKDHMGEGGASARVGTLLYELATGQHPARWTQ